MDQLGGILTAVLTVTTIIGTAFAGLQRANVQNLRESNKDLRDARDDLEKERDKLKVTVDQQASDIAALGRVVTGEVHLVALGDRLDEHHAEARDYWHRDEQISARTLKAIERLAGGTP